MISLPILFNVAGESIPFSCHYITCSTCGHTFKCSLGAKRPSHRNPMCFPEVSVDGVFESVHSVRLHNMLRESIPSVNNMLNEIVLSVVFILTEA